MPSLVYMAGRVMPFYVVLPVLVDVWKVCKCGDDGRPDDHRPFGLQISIRHGRMKI